MKRISLAIFAALLTMASTSFAATTATNSNTVAPTLQVTVKVQPAVSLTLLTGTTAGVGHCTVTATGAPSPDYTMDFGNVDALAIANTCASKFAPTTPGVTDAIYWTDYQLVPVYTSQSATGSQSLTAQVTANFGLGNVSLVRDTAGTGAVPAAVGDFSPISTASADPIATVADLDGKTPLTRFIGVDVQPKSGAGLNASQTATVTFTLTVN
ncbi:MAG TPA: hypothetical protein VFQ00_04475 [Terriglobales bacterium]|nr:hypothetical protein [Terriglobales bacterium]